MFGKNKEKDEEIKTEPETTPPETDESLSSEDISLLMDLGNSLEDPPKVRFTGIYGDINEEKCSEVIYSMLMLTESGKSFESLDPDDPKSELVACYEPFDFFISTFGGSALDMFSVYDMMRYIKEKVEIKTFGMGKVMSGGTLLLAAGTKGHRRIGKYCRVMIHGVVAGQSGNLLDLENEFEESKMTQNLYIEALANETDMTRKYIKNLIKKKTNVYISAQEAVDLGIADILI